MITVTFTNMRSLWVHVGNGIVSITLPINFACLGIAFDASSKR
ncbi:MAG: hypothetical protein V7K71_33735 [Nostoc sp.]